MLDQLFNIVKQFGQETVVNNPEVPNEYNQEVMAEASHTIAGGLKNMVAGGGLQDILNLFKGGTASAGSGGIGGIMKNPIVTMMIGYFMNKLVGKFKMSPSSATNVANNLIPQTLNNLIEKTKDPNNPGLTMDGLINSLIGGPSTSEPTPETGGGSPLQNLIEKVTGGSGNGNSGGGGFDLQDIIGKLTKKSQNNLAGGQGGGLMDMIKGFFN